jgi:hypothetical protein
MNERYKIREAKFFLARMEESVDDREAFRYYLSAFLTSARSVIQYAETESEATKAGRDWYKATVDQCKVAEFFRKKRNVNVHRGKPVRPSRDATVAPDGIGVVASVGSVVFFRDELVEEPSPQTKEEPPLPTPQENRTQTTVRDYFSDWPGPEDLFALSRRYIEELESFVQSGIEQGYISG